ncbi:hypothetical protein IAD21_00562 [Abditibacteriota bacterium]|nr:hypothetical protein IAD21_00562 [Abditibacteriota bacterium]
MGKIANAYRSRARRVRAVTQSELGREASMIRAGAREAVQTQLYDRTPLKVSKRLLRSISIQFLGNRFRVGFNTSTAPHAQRRINLKGVSKTGGHLLDMDVNGYIRANVYPRVVASRRAMMPRILGEGVVSINGR